MSRMTQTTGSIWASGTKGSLNWGIQVKGKKRRWRGKEVANSQQTGWEHVPMALVNVQPFCRRDLINRFGSLHPTSWQKSGDKKQRHTGTSYFSLLSSLPTSLPASLVKAFVKSMIWSGVSLARRARSGHGRVEQDVFPNYLTVYISFPCRPLL